MITANRVKDSLQGLVKELYARTVTLSERDEDVLEEFQSIQFSRYDEAGNKIEQANYNSDNSLLFKIVYSYNSTGKLVEQIHFDANESLLFKTVYEYDRDGRLIEQKSFRSDASLETTLRPVYTAEGLRIEEETLPLFEESGDTRCFYHIEETNIGFSARGGDKIRKIYDSEGKPLEITTHNNEGTPTSKILFVYENDGRLIEVAHYGGDEFYPCGERTEWQHLLEPFALRLIKIFLFTKCLYSFGVKGELRKVARCITYGSLFMSTVFAYDDKGRVIEEQELILGSLGMKKVYTYDEKGNKAEEIQYINNDIILQRQNYSRVYDSYGNWIKETVSQEFQMEERFEQSTTATYRTISYYSN